MKDQFSGKEKVRMTQTRRRLWSVSVFVLLLALAASFCAFGQETRASLRGKVTDPNGAVVQNATIVVTSEATGVKNQTQTNDEGDWRVDGLLPGLYEFDVMSTGFQASHYAGIDLQLNDQKQMDTRLHLGSETESVNVTASVPLIDTTSAVSGTVMTSDTLEELPTLSNAPTMFISMFPGASASSGVAGGIYQWSNGGLTNVAINGTGSTSANTTAINYLIDGGVDVNNGGQVAFMPPVDAVGQMRVITNAYDASLGRNLGTTMMMAMKTGGLKFHGDAYYNNQNNLLNANTYANDATNAPKTPIHIHYYGGTVSGPVWIPKIYDGHKKQTFFFFSWSGVHSVDPTNTGYFSVPDAYERTGNFSNSFVIYHGVTYHTKIYNPYSITQQKGVYGRTEYPNETLPYINPIAKAYLDLIGPANAPANLLVSNDANNYRVPAFEVNHLNSQIVRIDHAWNNSQHSYLSLRRNDWRGIPNSVFGNTTHNNVAYNLTVSTAMGARTNRQVTLDHSIVLKPEILLDMNYSLMNFWTTTTSPSAGQDPKALGFSSNYASQMQIPGIPELSGFLSGVRFGTVWNSSENHMNHNPKASVTQMWGNHTLRYGAEYMVQQSAKGGVGSSAGTLSFGKNWTNGGPVGDMPTGSGSEFASFLLGLPTDGSIPIGATGMWSQHFLGVYFQDDWRVTPKLTLDIGLRWDYERPVTERYNHLVSRFDPNYVQQDITTAAQASYTTLLSGSSKNQGIALLQNYRSDPSTFIARGGLLYAGVDGTSVSVRNALYKYFQPRVGFAYQLDANTVIRGGVGRFVQADFVTGDQTGWSQSTKLLATSDNYESAPTIDMANPYPNGLQAAIGNSLGKQTNVGTATSYKDPNMGRQYADIASLAIQRQIKNILIDSSFVLNEVHGGSMSWDVNNPSSAAWHASYDPIFTSTGAPALVHPGDTLVSNPFYQVSGIMTTASAYTSKNVSAYSLLRPNPLLGSLTETRATGLTRYYAFQNKVEKRYKNGFSLLSSFAWSKLLEADSFIGNQIEKPVICHQLSASDNKFQYVVTSVYQLPFGRNQRFGAHIDRALDAVAGGWKLAGSYSFQSGTPITLPTNSSLFKGGDPALNGRKTSSKWFDTSYFYPYPTSSTPRSEIATYPDWTGVQNLPGYNWIPTPSVAGYKNVQNGIYQDFATRVTYNQTRFGDIRNPYITNLILGVRKSFAITNKIPFELGIDTFNTLNHPRFGDVSTDPNSYYFGAIEGTDSSKWNQNNSPRAVQLTGKIHF
ncbi:MAG: carboxypeptidase-like regulatory domain-containing protein [Terracidiphilus sp.]|nr:carboxypeptidase-like regulatory domain-containing protein [Terracidiphilus sp.]